MKHQAHSFSLIVVWNSYSDLSELGGSNGEGGSGESSTHGFSSSGSIIFFLLIFFLLISSFSLGVIGLRIISFCNIDTSTQGVTNILSFISVESDADLAIFLGIIELPEIIISSSFSSILGSLFISKFCHLDNMDLFLSHICNIWSGFIDICCERNLSICCQ